jgi:bacteriorhodopsin
VAAKSRELAPLPLWEVHTESGRLRIPVGSAPHCAPCARDCFFADTQPVVPATDCVAKGLGSTAKERLIIGLWAVVSTCQALFMMTRAPKVTWEAVYLPMVEAILYSCSAGGYGMMRMGDGQMIPLSRMCSWLITCPIMLSQAFGIFDLQLFGISLRMPICVCSLIRTVCGIMATVTTDFTTAKWCFFAAGFCFFMCEISSVWFIFKAGIAKFTPHIHPDVPENQTALNRLYFMRVLFYFAWCAFPILWVISPTGLCLIGEPVSALAYLCADALCKNLYGAVQTNTVWQVLKGSWTPAKRPDEEAPAIADDKSLIGAHGRFSSQAEVQAVYEAPTFAERCSPTLGRAQACRADAS